MAKGVTQKLPQGAALSLPMFRPYIDDMHSVVKETVKLALFTNGVLTLSLVSGYTIWPKTPTTTRWNISRHSTSGGSDGGATSFREALQESSFEHCRPSNDFPWYSFFAMQTWSAICSSRFEFRVKRLLTIRFVKPSFGWGGGGGQRSRAVRLEARILELEQLKKFCLCYFWFDVSFHS